MKIILIFLFFANSLFSQETGYELSFGNWKHKKNITWSYDNDDAINIDISIGDEPFIIITDAIENALTLWQSATTDKDYTGGISISRVPSGGDIRFNFVTGLNNNQLGQAIPYTNNEGELTHYNINLNRNVHWSKFEEWSDAEGRDIYTTLLHEVGHAMIGLKDHVSSTGSILVANNTQSQRYLSSKDFSQTQFLYNPLTLTIRNSFSGGVIKHKPEGLVGDYLTRTHNQQIKRYIGSIDYLQSYDQNWKPTGETIDYLYKFTDWSKPGEEVDSNKIIQASIHSDVVYQANFEKYGQFSISNELLGSTNGGVIFVEGVEKNAPFLDWYKVNTNINITASHQYVFQDIQYSFLRWSDGITTASRSINHPNHVIISAIYSAKPLPPPSPSLVPNTEKVTFTWTNLQHSGVTHYEVWRSIDGGTPTYLATVSRNNPTFVDGSFVTGQTNLPRTIIYKLRSYFSLNSSHSDFRDFVVHAYEIQYQGDRLKPSFGLSKQLPTSFEIFNFPNPFNPTTTVNYQLPHDGDIDISIFDLMGKKVVTLSSGYRQAGYYSIYWSGKNDSESKVSSGVYIYRLVVKSIEGKQLLVKSGKMSLTK